MTTNTPKVSPVTKKKNGKRSDKDKEAWKGLQIDRKKQALAAVMQVTDRIISGQNDVTVRVSKPQATSMSKIPAWTDGKTITLNELMLDDVLARRNVDMPSFIRTFKGTNYHELAHCMFTPRLSTPARAAVTVRGSTLGMADAVQRAYMILEDQRIETLYTTQYSPTIPYFQSAVASWLLHDVTVVANVYPLLYGRKFMPAPIRAAVRQAFIADIDASTSRVPGGFKRPVESPFQTGEQVAREVERLIDLFLTVTWIDDISQAVDIISDFARLFDSPLPQPPNGGNDCGGTEVTNGSISQDDAVDATEDVKDKQEADREEWEQAIEDAESEDDDSDDGDAGDTGDAGDGDDAAGEDGDSDADGSDADGESDDAPDSGDADGGESDDEPSQGDGGAGAGSGAQDGGYDPTVNPAAEMLDDLIDDIESDAEHMRDLTDTINAVKVRVSGEGLPNDGFVRNPTLREATPKELNHSEAMVRLLAALQFDLEPTWLRGRSMGRLNTRRYLQHVVDPSRMDIFDQYDEGAEDEASVEVVICLDLSGSMSGQLAKCSAAMWMLKRTFDKCEIRTTVLGYSNGMTVLYRPDVAAPKKRVPIHGVWGGTDATEATRSAYNLLMTSQAANRVFINITDGCWKSPEKSEDLIGAMVRDGVTTILFAFGQALEYGLHKCEIGLAINDISEVVDVVKRLVESVLLKARDRVA